MNLPMVVNWINITADNLKILLINEKNPEKIKQIYDELFKFSRMMIDLTEEVKYLNKEPIPVKNVTPKKEKKIINNKHVSNNQNINALKFNLNEFYYDVMDCKNIRHTALTNAWFANGANNEASEKIMDALSNIEIETLLFNHEKEERSNVLLNIRIDISFIYHIEYDKKYGLIV